MSDDDQKPQRRSGGGVERKRTVSAAVPVTLVILAAFAALLVMQVQTVPDPLPQSAYTELPARNDPVDTALVRAGNEIFRYRCAACHKLGAGRVVGPDLAGVTRRRPWPWIRAMVTNPDSMLRRDSLARAMLREYGVPMPDAGVTGPEFRALLEFLRGFDAD